MLLVINLVELFDSLNCAKVQLQFKKKKKKLIDVIKCI